MKTKWCERVSLPAAGSVLGQIVNFAISMIEVESDDFAVKFAPQGWAVWNAIANGRVGFYETDITPLRGWWIFAGSQERDRYGQPTVGVFRTDSDSSNTMIRNVTNTVGEGMKLIRANPMGTPPIQEMRRDAARIELAYRLLDANLRAAKRTQILQCDKNQKDTLLEILEDQADGDFSIVDRNVMSEIGMLDVSVPFVGGDVHTLINNLWADALRRWGGVTPPQYKAERTQSAEVSATVAESVDNIYIMLDTMNADAERLGVPVKFKYRGFGARFDTEPAQTNEQEGGEIDAGNQD